MAGRVCFYCKRWIEEGEKHDCWTTTEAALTRDLPEDLRDAWERLRETAAAFGEQRIYASHKSIMFSRKSCYFFVRPRRNFLELCVFLGRTLTAPQVRRVDRSSSSRVAHMIRISHRDEVEPPITNWLAEAYGLSEAPPAARKSRSESEPVSGPSAKKHGDDKTAPKLDPGKQLNRVRRICKSIPGAIEKLSHGEPAFFTPKRVFAMFANNHHGDGRLGLWLPAADGVQAALIEEAPEIYYRPPYVGVNGWVGVELSRVDDERLAALIREAFRVVDLKAAESRRSKPLQAVAKKAVTKQAAVRKSRPAGGR